MRNTTSITWMLLASLALQSFGGCETPSQSDVVVEVPQKRTGEPNLDYWLFLNAEFSSLHALSDDSTGEPASGGISSDFLQQRTAHTLLRASGQGVDPELITWALKVVNYYAESSVWSSFMDQLAAEDQARRVKPIANSRRPWLAATMGSNLYSTDQALREEGKRVCEILSARYGREFPPSSF